MANSLDFINITSKPLYDDLFTSYKYIAHHPLASSTYSFNDDVRFQVQNQNELWLPSRSYIIIEGKINRAPAESTATLVENGVMHAFSECKYLLNGYDVDETRGLGTATTTKGMRSIASNELGAYESAGWGTSFGRLIIRAEGGNTFSVCIPLKLILGFAEDYNKIILGVRQELSSRRSTTDVNALLSTVADDTSSLEISKMIWMLPTLGVSDTARASLLNIMRKDIPITIPFRSWSWFENPTVPVKAREFTWTITSMSKLENPRFIIVTFQTKRKNIYTASINTFDHTSVSDIKVFLNSDVYPSASMNLDFTGNKYAPAYKMYSDFHQSYYGRNIRTPRVNFTDFKSSHTIFVIDCSTIDERAKRDSTDIRLEVKMSVDTPSDTVCNCLILHDKTIEYTPLSNIVRKV